LLYRGPAGPSPSPLLAFNSAQAKASVDTDRCTAARGAISGTSSRGGITGSSDGAGVARSITGNGL
jgi:hypothetical protein